MALGGSNAPCSDTLAAPADFQSPFVAHCFCYSFIIQKEDDAQLHTQTQRDRHGDVDGGDEF